MKRVEYKDGIPKSDTDAEEQELMKAEVRCLERKQGEKGKQDDSECNGDTACWDVIENRIQVLNQHINP